MKESNSRKTILVVDDEPNVRSLLRKSLSKNYVVLEASNGETAIDMALREKPDLILMDIMMPKIDGYTACYRIKEAPATKGIPVIMLTALGYQLNTKLGKEMGANGYMTKPFTSQALLDTIEQSLKNPKYD